MSNQINDQEEEALQKSLEEVKKPLNHTQGRGKHTLRESTKDILEPKHDDAFLVRWLRARNLDPAKAEQMLRKSLEWRKQKNMDSIVNNYVPSEFLKRYYPIGEWGFDKEGCPVWSMPFGYYDIRGLLQSVKHEDLVKRLEVVVEKSLSRMEQQTKKLGRPITQHIIVVDVEHFGISHFMSKPAFNFIKQLFYTYDNNYPETLKAGIFINASMTVQMCYNLLKPFIHENTQKKIQIYGKDEWKDVLNNLIEPSEIPEQYGGTFQESQNGNWWDVLKLPRQIPESNYVTPGKRLSAEKDTTSVTVANNDKLCIEIPVKKVGTALKWIFQTEDSDIGFGISLKTSIGIEDIIPVERVDTHLFAEEGCIVCDKVGTYEFCFDNKFSYLRSKKLTYKLETLTPDEHMKTNTADN